jgi:A/G-specific adenine glycosylase
VAARTTELRPALAAWFARAQRDLPWRRRGDAYAIWVSEVMLQQTTVAAVVPYFERFLERFPTLDALARAPLERVLESWAGLGYYRRARHLHACAQTVVSEHGGRFPEDEASLLRLPGIGPYTAGAIASIAFDRRAPLVDGNVARVLSRLFRVPGDPRSGAARARLWEIAAELVPEKGASVHNQALMELGALVCQPGGQARCGDCPLERMCEARAAGEVERFPELAPRPAARARRDLALAFFDDGRVLVGRRRDDDVWGGLWELPRVTLLEGESDRDGARRLGREILGSAAALASEDVVARVRHTVMNERIELRVFEGTLRGEPEPKGHAELLWLEVDRSSELALPSPQKKAIETLKRTLLRGR